MNTKVITKQDISKIFKGRVINNMLITSLESSEGIHEITLNLGRYEADFQLGQSIGVVVEGPHEFGNMYHFRLYSIIDYQQRKLENIIKLCVKRCFYIDDINGEEHKGVASNYLCDLKIGDRVSLLGPYSRPFHIPEDEKANIIMIGMGTGIAPFRAYIRHIYTLQGAWKGQVRLFYGARTGLEMLYMNDQKNDISQYYDEETFKAIQSVSSVPYGDVNSSIANSLSSSLRKNAGEVWSMVQSEGSHLFIAGLEVIEEKLTETFNELAGSPEEWKRMKEKMKNEERYQEILY